MPVNERLQALFERYIAKTCTTEEQDELQQFIVRSENDGELKSLLDGLWGKLPADFRIGDKESSRILGNILPARKIPVFKWVAVAAAVAMVIGLGIYFLALNGRKGPDNQVAQARKDVAPGGNKAVLTLANGSTIVLDSAQNGTLAQQGNAKIVKLNNGQIAYTALHEKPTETVYNVLSIPNGGQYQLTLPDGSRVWLNAASSIRYPTAFTGNTRNVEITGEAYFEVAKDPRMPFTVSVDGMEVKVLGTHFNVNAYPNEQSVKTTLLEGSVKITNGSSTALLKPGQQAQVNNTNDIKIVNADVDEAVAWKEGFFHFESADLKTILRQYARWYDVDVEYEGAVSDRKYFVLISRNSTLMRVLQMLQDNNISYRLEGKKLIVKSG